MNIRLRTINHRQQRYPTIGDWLTNRRGARTRVREIRVSRLGDEDFEFLVALHELIEAHLCTRRGITQRVVDAFDQRFERQRGLGLRAPDAEPGDHQFAPYRKEHRFATRIERLVAKELGVNWADYERRIAAL